MLVVDSIVPGGPADGHLEPGDALIKLNGRVVCHFLPMEALLDDHVGRNVTVEVERGGVHVTVELKVCVSSLTKHWNASSCVHLCAINIDCSQKTHRRGHWRHHHQDPNPRS